MPRSCYPGLPSLVGRTVRRGCPLRLASPAPTLARSPYPLLATGTPSLPSRRLQGMPSRRPRSAPAPQETAPYSSSSPPLDFGVLLSGHSPDLFGQNSELASL